MTLSKWPESLLATPAIGRSHSGQMDSATWPESTGYLAGSGLTDMRHHDLDLETTARSSR
jgi:hypothetical protein